jgi:hypothetical protein
MYPVVERTLFSLAYEGRYHSSRVTAERPPFTFFDPPANALNRVDHIFTAAFVQAITDKFLAQPVYRYKFTHYTGGVRRADHLHSIGLSLHYFFSEWLSLRGFITYDTRISDLTQVPDYNKLDAGGGLNITWRF